jgi:hypothetical protein
MKFKVYTGELARNCSVNITCHGSFEAKDITEALSKIQVNVKSRYLKKWQFPGIFLNPGEWIQPDYIQPLHDALRFHPFVCIGEEPFKSNVIWEANGAYINFFDSPKHP